MSALPTSPWSEKYRPKHFSELFGNEQLARQFESFCIRHREEETKEGGTAEEKMVLPTVPHLILQGGSGRGKTTTVQCLMRELFDGECYREYVLQHNASRDRTASVLRS